MGALCVDTSQTAKVQNPTRHRLPTALERDERNGDENQPTQEMRRTGAVLCLLFGVVLGGLWAHSSVGMMGALWTNTRQNNTSQTAKVQNPTRHRLPTALERDERNGDEPPSTVSSRPDGDGCSVRRSWLKPCVSPLPL
jgi:hypothetical protein